jgi:hypothetical protein
MQQWLPLSLGLPLSVLQQWRCLEGAWRIHRSVSVQIVVVADLLVAA